MNQQSETVTENSIGAFSETEPKLKPAKQLNSETCSKVQLGFAAIKERHRIIDFMNFSSNRGVFWTTLQIDPKDFQWIKPWLTDKGYTVSLMVETLYIGW